MQKGEAEGAIGDAAEFLQQGCPRFVTADGLAKLYQLWAKSVIQRRSEPAATETFGQRIGERLAD